MCHPWLAAGVLGFLVVQASRELGPVLLQAAPAGEPATTGFLGARLRAWFRGRVEPLGDALLAAGLTANRVTALQLLVSVLCGAAYASGWVFTAGVLLVASGTLDVVDGGMARKAGAASPRGAFIDSVVDRYGESAVFAGLVVLYRGTWVLWAVLAASLGALMVSYTRARAEALGAECRVGLMQRPERYVVLGGGSVLAVLTAHLTCGAVAAETLLAACVVAVGILANATALQRTAAVLRRLA